MVLRVKDAVFEVTSAHYDDCCSTLDFKYEGKLKCTLHHVSQEDADFYMSKLARDRILLLDSEDESEIEVSP